ncbi:MAG: SDR family oxidoreductase [Hyphomonadaceae bacterium]|nr:SDR family oxidoreductase [Hyphomonadaceae bacterium]
MFKDKIALVTGGATGIGAATSRLLAARGAHVVVVSDQPLATIEAFCDELRATGASATAIPCDVRDRAQIGAALAAVERTHGELHMLVNSAGVFHRGPIMEMSPETVDLLFGVNAVGAISMVQAALPLMIRTGDGAIVNISSAAAQLGVETCAVYAATKAAVTHFTRTLAPELRRTGVRINCVGPGSVRTPMLGFKYDTLTDAQRDAMVKREAASNSPYGNALMAAEDIAEIVLFLLSDAAKSIHGATIIADQGITAAMRAPGG